MVFFLIKFHAKFRYQLIQVGNLIHLQKTQMNFIASGIKKGWSGFIWMLKILIPISFLTTLLQCSGVLGKIDFLLEPAMAFINLPAMAAFPLIVGLLAGIYGAIATMAVLPLTGGQMTLITVFLLISHNLVQEGIIQGKSGINPFLATLFRLAASVVTVLIVMQFIDTGPAETQGKLTKLFEQASFGHMIQDWGISTAYLCIKMLVIICILMILLEGMKTYNLVSFLVNPLNPILKILGLSSRVGILWVTAVFFGIAYGGAVIVEETKGSDLSRQELMKLHLSIGINHAIIEDPAVFLSLGLNAFWLWIPRIIASIVFVHLFTLIVKSAEMLGMPLIKPSSEAEN